MPKLLIVDDDLEILQLNKEYLEPRGFEVACAASAAEAGALFTREPFDCILLDICMNGLNGYDFCRDIKARSDVLVVFITSLSEEEALVEAFRCGGDDYLVKPYSLKEMEVRIRARIRGASAATKGQLLSFPPLEMDVTARRVTISKTAVPLTSSEFDILLFLMRNAGTPFSQEVIYKNVWNTSHFGNSHSIQAQIAQLRKKLAAICPEKTFLYTIWGKGYLFQG